MISKVLNSTFNQNRPRQANKCNTNKPFRKQQETKEGTVIAESLTNTKRTNERFLILKANCLPYYGGEGCKFGTFGTKTTVLTEMRCQQCRGCVQNKRFDCLKCIKNFIFVEFTRATL